MTNKTEVKVGKKPLAVNTQTPKKVPVKAKPAPAISGGLGLESIGDLSSLLDSPAGSGSEKPIQLPLSVIDEDPNQPRTADNPGFTPDSIAEIGATIKARGVKSPISVRDNPLEPGRYLINHGARRYRGSIWAEKKSIPAFVDNDYNEADQVIENLQRNELTAREIADFIGRELAKGRKKGDIAKDIGKSGAYITQHVTLLDLPDPIAEAFMSGRVNDVTVVNELVTAYKKASDKVYTWLADENQELTRGSVKLLREFLDDKSGLYPNTADASNGKTHAEDDNDTYNDQSGGALKKEPKEADSDKIKKAIVQVIHDGRPGRIILTRRPPVNGYAWVKYDDDGYEFEVNLSTVTLVAIVEGA